MKKSCGLIAAVWLGLVGLYAYLAWPKIYEVVPTVMVAVLGGTFAAVLVGSFIGLFTGARDRRALKRAIRGDAPRDGRLEAAWGPIRPSGSPLIAPFTGRPCVAYEYDVKTPGRDQSDFAGVALAPCAIDGARGSARVLGWVALDQFPDAPSNKIDVTRGADYLRRATLERMGVLSIVSVFMDLFADEDGAIRKDFQIGAESIDLHGKTIKEKIVPVGDKVTVIGRWSEPQRGFAPAGSAAVNRIFSGEPSGVVRSVSGSSLQTFGMAVFFFVVLHGMLGVMYIRAPKRDSKGELLPDRVSVLDERDCDRQKELLGLGADPNELGRTGIRPLMNASREGSMACVQNLIAAGARLEDADWSGDTAFAQAVMANREDTMDILRRAGAKDFRINAENGRAMTADAEPFGVVKDYIAAVHSGDFETMARLRAGSSVRLMRERADDLPFWRSLRPKDPALVSGWMTGSAATLTVHGATPDGERTIFYHVEKDAEGWRIHREWFPE